jgi:DNA-binding XRE family transcriptional regulator
MRNRIGALRADRKWSQGELAERLGVSRQAVNAMESGKTEPGLPLAMRVAWIFDKPVEEIFIADVEDKMTVLNAPWQYRDVGAIAFNEVRVLDEMGREGWELTSFGFGALSFRRPDDAALRSPWEYLRTEGILSGGDRASFEAKGWRYCGSWVSFYHYFKRPVEKP